MGGGGRKDVIEERYMCRAFLAEIGISTQSKTLIDGLLLDKPITSEKDIKKY